MRTRPAGAALEVLHDRWCAPRALDNPLRRWWVPSAPEVARLAPPLGATVADLGAGVGFHVPELLRAIGPAGRLLLVDPDARNLEIAVRRAPRDGRVSDLLGSAARLDGIPEASVDRVLLSLVLCCLVDKEAVMDETWRILRPGGQVLATFPRRRWRWWAASRSLRVSPERWASVRARHPWVDRPVRTGAWIERHLLEKPAGDPAASVAPGRVPAHPAPTEVAGGGVSVPGTLSGRRR